MSITDMPVSPAIPYALEIALIVLLPSGLNARVMDTTSKGFLWNPRYVTDDWLRDCWAKLYRATQTPGGFRLPRENPKECLELARRGEECLWGHVFAALSIIQPPGISGAVNIFENARKWSNKTVEERQDMRSISELVRDLQKTYPLTDACWAVGRLAMKMKPQTVVSPLNNDISQTSGFCWSTLLPEEMGDNAEGAIDDDNDTVADKYWVFDENIGRMMPYHQM